MQPTPRRYRRPPFTPRQAEHHAHVKTRETLWVFAQRYHTTLRAVERLNHIHYSNALPSQLLLAIPQSPRGLWAHDSQQQLAVVTADRVRVRIGPNEYFRRRDLVDPGTHPLALAYSRNVWSSLLVLPHYYNVACRA